MSSSTLLSPKKKQLSCQNIIFSEIKISRNGTQASTTHHRAQRDAPREARRETRVGRESRVSFLEKLIFQKINTKTVKERPDGGCADPGRFGACRVGHHFLWNSLGETTPDSETHTTIAINIPLL